MIKISRMIKVEAIFSAFRKTFTKDYYYVGERHNFWELVYVVRGSIGAAEDGKVYDLKAGDIIFHKPMEFHRLWVTDNTDAEVIIISFSATGMGFDFLGDGVFRLSDELLEILIAACESAEHCMDFDDDITNQLISNQLEKLILLLARERTTEPRQKKTIGTQNYKAIVRVLNDNIEKNLSAEEIAELCGLSLSNLKKTFKRFSGIGVMEYYNNLKITKAMSMIIHDDMSMAAISEKLGYSSPNYFSESFKKKSGMTPTEYKKRFEQDIR